MLLVELTNLGDAVTLLYVIRAFRSSLPGVSLQVLVDKRFAHVLEHLCPGVKIHGVRRPDHPWGVIQAVRKARRSTADLALSVSPAYRNAAVVLTSRSPYRAGYLRTGGSSTPSLVPNPLEGIGFRAPEGIFYQDGTWLERRWKLFDLLGIRAARNASGFALSESLLQVGLQRLRNLGVLNGRAHLVVHPFSSWEFRSWPVSRYLSLIERILGEYSYDVVILCSKNEEQRLQPFSERFSGNSRVRCLPSEILLDSAVLLTCAKAVIGNDSGPLHLASAMGTPALGIYGPADPRHTAPPRVCAIYHGAECSPCDQQICVQEHHPCLTSISVDEVMEMLGNLLRQGAQSLEA